MGLSRKPHVLVVGDVMLDVTIRQNEYRTSQEDPSVQVFPMPRPLGYRYKRSKTTQTVALGGAGNLAANLAAQGCDVTLWTSHAFSSDEWAYEVHVLCSSIPGLAATSIDSADRTTLKVRYYAGSRLVARVDRDGVAANCLYVEDAASKLRRPVDAVVMTDYAKGLLCRDTIDSIHKFVPPVDGRWSLFVDPHVTAPELWRPEDEIDTKVLNWDEAEADLRVTCNGSVDTSPLDRLRLIHATGSTDRTVLKLGKQGSIGVDRDNVPVSIPAILPAELFDVQGAGDTYLAAYVAARLREVSFEDSCLLASAAAGTACGHAGTAVIGLRDTVLALKASGRLGVPNRGLDTESVYLSARRLRAMGFKVGYTNGCFDLRLHAGHRNTIAEAARGCDFLFVGVDSDVRVSKLKGPGRPFISASERVASIASLAGVRAAFEFDCPPEEVLTKLRPNVVFKGLRSADAAPEFSVISDDSELVLVPVIDVDSTTETVSRIKS